MAQAESLPQRFAESMGALLGPEFPRHIGLAVSGGGDSMAMLHLAAGWARVYGIQLWVVTIDHGLRDASAAEAAMVAGECKTLGLPHNTLKWEGWDRSGNLQDAARIARLSLISRWRGVCNHVLMAHTQDDQAETLLMRLARGSGVDGLSAMRAVRDVQLPTNPRFVMPGGPPWPATIPANWQVVRPLLTTPRSALRHFATTLKIPFVDDPSNVDPQFARVRMRHLIGQEGLSVQTLSSTAQRMARASEALGIRAHQVAQDILQHETRVAGGIVLKRDGFAEVETETQLRILAAALQHVGHTPYRPRLDPLEAALDRLLSGGTTTLCGCVMIAQRDRIYIAREPNAVAGMTALAGHDCRWDEIWCLYGSEIAGCAIKPLGEQGLAMIPTDVRTGLPRLALAGLPAVWRDDALLACKPFGFGPCYVAEQRRETVNFPHSLLMH